MRSSESIRRINTTSPPPHFFTAGDKFPVSKTGDAYEQEATKIASGAVNGQQAAPALKMGQPGVSRAASGAGPQQVSASAIPFFSGSQPLPASARTFFEPALRSDLSRVQIHNDAAANESAHAMQAKAYTVGDHIFFGAGRYQPESESGRRLLAHELTHTVQQQGNAGMVQRDGEEETGEGGPTVDFSVLPPELKLRLFHFVLNADTSHVQLDYRTRGFMAGLSYQYGDALSFNTRFRDFSARIGWTPGDNIFSLGGSYGQWNLSASTRPDQGRFSLGLRYGAPLLPSFASMQNTFTAGGNSLTNMVGGLPYGLQDPIGYYNMYQSDIENISETVDLVERITESGRRRIQFGAAFNLSYDPTNRLVVGFTLGGRF